MIGVIDQCHNVSALYKENGSQNSVAISFHIRARTTGMQAVSHQGFLEKENITTPPKAGIARTLPIKTQVCSSNQPMLHFLPISTS